MGRAAMDNPSIFADADRYFYGLEKNPCRNRRQVFEEYCRYLEELYPRRCCDDDPRITHHLPVPDIRPAEGQYCSICAPIYLKDKTGNAETINGPLQPTRLQEQQPRMASRLIGRSLIPIRGMFFGLPKSKQFNHRLDVLAQDVTVRDCGPAYIIRQALEDIIPSYLLDQDFVTSEDYSMHRFH